MKLTPTVILTSHREIEYPRAQTRRFFKESSHLSNHIPMRFPMRTCVALLVTVWTLVSAPSGGYAQDPFFDAITRDVVMGMALTADSINGSNNASNLVPKGSIVVYLTKEGRYGKFKVLRYSYTLWLRIITYAADGSVHFFADSVSIDGTCFCDLDSAKQCNSGPRSDFKWDMRTDTNRAIDPRNGAQFAVYRTATTVDPPVGDGPQLMALHQNYPNPFNPLTTIPFDLPIRSLVTLTVFNMLGQSVSTLVNGEQAAGYHEVKFEGNKLASGVYLYRMQAGSYVETKKLLMIR